MNGLPRSTGELLYLFGVDKGPIGDLDAAVGTRRSRMRCWYQVARTLWRTSCKVGITQPLYTTRGIALGWFTLLTTFVVIDAPMLNRVRLEAYRTGDWAAYWTAVCILSYVGFALSAWVVARAHRRTPGLVILYTASVLIALGLSVMLTALSPDPVSLPHALFPLVSVALPYQWRTGLVLAPAVMLLAGFLTLVRSRPSRA